jgi:hypothetical protein
MLDTLKDDDEDNTMCLQTHSIMARASDGTSQELSSILNGNEFHPRLKTSSRISSFPKHRLRPDPVIGNDAMHRPSSHMGCRGSYIGGEGSGVFSICVRRPFFLS